MAVRLRPQSAAWMAPHALAAQLNAQTGQIAGQGVASLLGGISTGINAVAQKREQRRAEGINESRYQDSLGFRQQEMDLRKQAADREDAEGRYAILSQAAKGAEMKATLWQLSNPGQPLPPEMMMESEQLKSSLRAITSQFAKGVPTPQVVAERQPPRDGMLVNGKSVQEMTDAELDDFMTKSQAGQVDTTYRGGATRDMGQGVGEQPAAAPSAPAAPESAAMDVPSSGDPTIDAFSDRIRAMGSKAAELQAELDTFENLGPEGKRAPRAAALRTAIGKLNTDIKIAEGRMQVYAETRKQKESAQAISDRQAADRAAKAVEDAAEVARLTADAKAAGYTGPAFQSAEAAKSWITESRQMRLQDDRQVAMEKMKRLGHEQAMVRQDKAKENRIQIEAVAAANRVDASPEFKQARDVAIRLEELAESKRRDFVFASENMKPADAAAARAAYDRASAEYEAQVRRMAGFATAPVAPKAAGAPAAAPAVPPNVPAPASKIRAWVTGG